MQRVPASKVVAGDSLLPSEGNGLVADGWLPQVNKLQTDEPLLTGESVAADKHPLEPLQRIVRQTPNSLLRA
jgi:magnesium-transporting ATPase (P-type)